MCSTQRRNGQGFIPQRSGFQVTDGLPRLAGGMQSVPRNDTAAGLEMGPRRFLVLLREQPGAEGRMFMNCVILDGYTLNPGDLDWAPSGAVWNADGL